MPAAPSLDEFELIARYFSKRTGAHAGSVSLGVGDDAALIRLPPDSELAVSVDTLVAGRHFPDDCAARAIGHRALAVNLSDMAAMGATPAWATLALTVPSAEEDWLDGFAAGFWNLADEYQVALVGGDTTRGPLTISVQIMGHVAVGSALRRGGAKAGDVLAVTGTLGDAGAGLALVTGQLRAGGGAAAELVRRFEYPAPRVRFGAAARGLARAAMDLSDGIAGDLPKLAAASRLAAHVDVARLPLSPALSQVVAVDQARAWALSAGDDYELLIAVPAAHLVALTALAHGMNLSLTSIGELRPGTGVHWTCNGAAMAAPAPGYDHFR